MCMDTEAQSCFGVIKQCDGSNVAINGYGHTGEISETFKLCIELNSPNFEKDLRENEVRTIFRFQRLVDFHRRGDLYGMEFPLHTLSAYILKYQKVVEENIDLFSKANGIIYNSRFGQHGLIGAPDHPAIQKQILEFVAEVKEPLLMILEKLKAAFQEPDFKKQIKAEQKYYSKMNIKYTEFTQELIDGLKIFCMIEFDLCTRDFIFDHYTSGSICTVNFDAVLEDLASDRKLFIDSTRNEFRDDFIGCVWKLNHNLSRGFYLSFLFFMKNSRNVKTTVRLQNFLTNSVYNNKNYKLIRSGSWLQSYSPNSDSFLRAVTKYVRMDSIFNLKIEGHRTLGRTGFKNMKQI